MDWIFADEGNRKALGMVKEEKLYKIHIREPEIITIRNEELFFKIKSALIQNKIDHLVINN
jgi:hypothetical protein